MIKSFINSDMTMPLISTKYTQLDNSIHLVLCNSNCNMRHVIGLLGHHQKFRFLLDIHFSCQPYLNIDIFATI